MLRISIVLVFFNLLFSSCNKEEKPQRPTFDRYGVETKDCSIRQADGMGPYEPLGRYTSHKCFLEISKLCNKKKYKQIHRTKGHFARGKFGKRIKIGICP